MRIEPATCPVCGVEFDPLRARAIAVLDGKVRAYCSAECKDRKQRADEPAAAREGLRPEECEGGHCGVDLGSVRGEPVICTHDGVVERVVRDAAEGGRRGNEGRFIRINHKGGTIVTSYMHLDSIRDDLKPGI